MERFGNYLYQLRSKPGQFISQQKLSKLSGYTQTYISLIETGKAHPSRGCIRLILDALGISTTSYMSLVQPLRSAPHH